MIPQNAKARVTQNTIAGPNIITSTKEDVMTSWLFELYNYISFPCGTNTIAANERNNTVQAICLLALSMLKQC